MNGPLKLMVPLVAALALAACNGGSSSMPGTAGQSTAQAQNAGHFHQLLQDEHVKQVCADDGPGTAMCSLSCAPTSRRRRIQRAQNRVCILPTSRLAYNLPATKGGGQIVAIVDAYDNPNIAKDLKNLPCGFRPANRKFHKVQSKGGKEKLPHGRCRLGLGGRPRRRDGLRKLSKLHHLPDRGQLD